MGGRRISSRLSIILYGDAKTIRRKVPFLLYKRP
jgi:hypothetical protein